MKIDELKVGITKGLQEIYEFLFEVLEGYGNGEN